MGRVATALAIAQILFTLGPRIIKIALEIWDIVEEFSKRKQSDQSFEKYDGKKPTTAEKIARFKALIKSNILGRNLTDKEVDRVREVAHSIRTRKRRRRRK